MASQPTRHDPCPLCLNDPGDSVWPTASEQGDSFTLRVCSTCGSGHLDPAPTQAELARAYSSAYYGSGETKFPSLIERFRRFCASALARSLLRRLPPSPRVLDVGCGDGGFLLLLKAAGAGECHGIEPPGDAADRASLLPGIILHREALHTVKLPSSCFDLVSARHVYEHLPAPLTSLDQMADFVRPGGMLFLSFPNIRSWQAQWFQGAWFHLDAPRHLHLPDIRILTEYLEKKSFVLMESGYWSLEQNLYGWLQSALNYLDGNRNFLYERIKGNSNFIANRGLFFVVLHALAAGVLLPPAFFLDLCSVIFRRGATVQLTFRRPC